jgi:hypothetical protein
VLSTLLTARSAAADFSTPVFAWAATWPCPAVGTDADRFGCMLSPVLSASSTAVEFVGPRSHVTRYLAFRRSLNGCGLVVCSPVLTAISAAAEFARPAFAFLVTWPSHRSWDGSGLLRFSVSALTSTPCYGTLGCCTDAVSVCSTVPVVRFGPGRETFSTARAARSTCPGFRIPGYVEFPNAAFASSGTWPSRRPCRTFSARFGWCFPRASRPFSTPKSRLHGTRSRVTPLLGLPPFCDRIRPGSVGVFPGLHDLSRLRRAEFTTPGLP